MPTMPPPSGPGPARAATIADVARVAGVSPAAVSKVIRNAYGVSPMMKEKVDRAIEELGYRPSLAARSMRGSSFTIGFEIPDLGNDFLFAILRGATEALQNTKYQIIVAPADADLTLGYRAIASLADRHVDGIVAISPLVGTQWLEKLATRIPLVMIGRHDEPINYDVIFGDDVSGTRLVMEHLFALGHSRITHLTRTDDITSTEVRTPHAYRLQTYLKAMREAGLDREIRVERTGGTMRESEEAAHRLLSGSNRPTAVFAGNDEIALGVLNAAGGLGLTQRDLAVVGYDDIAVARLPGVSLTTVEQFGNEMGRQAIALLLERLDGRLDSKRVMTKPELRIRRSSSESMS